MTERADEIVLPWDGSERRAGCEVCDLRDVETVSLVAPAHRLHMALCPGRATDVQRVLLDWLRTGRDQTGEEQADAPRPSHGPGRRLADGEDSRTIRAWAARSGFPVARHGGISDIVLEAYRRRLDAPSPQD